MLITTFEPDKGYVETLLGKNGNIRIYPKKKKGASQRGSGNQVPSHLNESPFAINIADSDPKVNRNDKISLKDRLALPDGEKRGYDGYSMSNNARDAYSGGEMPLSKWSRTDFCSYYIA